MRKIYLILANVKKKKTSHKQKLKVTMRIGFVCRPYAFTKRRHFAIKRNDFFMRQQIQIKTHKKTEQTKK